MILVAENDLPLLKSENEVDFQGREHVVEGWPDNQGTALFWIIYSD